MATLTDGGVTRNYTYDGVGRLLSGSLPGSRNIAYTYDGRGNISTEMTDNVQTAYTYDGLNRLKTVTKGGVTTTYAYDANNNRLSDTTSDGSVTEYVYDDDGRLVTITKNGQVTDTYSYNELGALTAHNGDTFTYNEWDKLVQFTPETSTPTTYAYDAEGIRVAKNTVHYANDLNKNVAADSNGSQMLWGRGPMAREVNGQWYYYITNAHGDVLALVDDSGTVRNTYQYDAWGNTIQKHETVDNPFRYNGQFTDDETGLIYLRSRYYDPKTGRFTSEDGARDGMNWYAYCGGNPVNFVDINGFAFKPIRELAAPYGLTVNWNPVANKAYIFVGNGVIEFYESFGGDGGGSYVQDGVMYVDDAFFSKQYEEMYTSYIADTSVDTVTDLGWVIDVAFVGGVCLAKGGVAAATSPQTVVLGSYPMYIQKAKEIGAQFFQIPMSLWEKLTYEQQWALNREFLDKAIAQSATFLVEARGAINENTFLYKEIQYLLEHGYQWLDDLSGLIKP